jgi:folate-dependent phosphoribosylglycinamide formyltransferase PurN
MKKVVILTSDELRHNYFKIKFSLQKDINVLKTYCDVTKKKYDLNNTDFKDIQNIHFVSRYQTERDFFGECVSSLEDLSNSQYIKRGEINKDEYIEEICRLAPDFIISYGCCIIKPKLINLFKDRIINVHLGLSPYYFGSGTNFHPFVNKELSAIGCTFMYMDAGIDTGKIIHQLRAEVGPCDNVHQIGNRLIKKMTQEFIDLIKNFERVEDKTPLTNAAGKTYKVRDCTAGAVQVAYENIRKGICLEYLQNKNDLDLEFPLIKQDFLC